MAVTAPRSAASAEQLLRVALETFGVGLKAMATRGRNPMVTRVTIMSADKAGMARTALERVVTNAGDVDQLDRTTFEVTWP